MLKTNESERQPSNLGSALRAEIVGQFREWKTCDLIPEGCKLVDPETGKDYTDDVDDLFESEFDEDDDSERHQALIELGRSRKRLDRRISK